MNTSAKSALCQRLSGLCLKTYASAERENDT
jgi:hypothetical protein